MTCLISLFSAIKSSCTGLVRCSRPDSKAVFLSCLVPYRTCSDLWHPNGQIPYEDYKRRSPPPSLIWPLRWIKNPLNLSFLRSNSLSLSSFNQIQAFWDGFEPNLEWPIRSSSKSTSPTISMCSLLLVIRPLDGLGVLWEPPRLWWASKSLYCPLHCGNLIVETELDLGDHSMRFVVERDPVLYGHLNGNVGNLCGYPNFRNKSCVLCSLCLSWLSCCYWLSLFLH
jgi:hypothetical protein